MEEKKNCCTTWESWLRCQMPSGLENDVINTRGTGHTLKSCFGWISYCCSSRPLMFYCLFTADWKAPLHLDWQLTHWSSHENVRCHLQENFIQFHQPSPHFAGNSFNTLSREKKPTYHFTPELWSQNAGIYDKSESRFCQSFSDSSFFTASRNTSGNYNINYWANFSFQVFKLHCWITKVAGFLGQSL